MTRRLERCPWCLGGGAQWADPCALCDGAGRVEAPERPSLVERVLLGWAGLVGLFIGVVWSKLAGERPHRRVP